MTPANLYPPIAAATIVTVLVFAFLWRGQKAEQETGSVSASSILVMILLSTGMGGFFYYRNSVPVVGWLDVFGTAMVAETMATGILYAGSYVLFRSRGEPWRKRAFPAFVVVMFLLMIFGNAVT